MTHLVFARLDFASGNKWKKKQSDTCFARKPSHRFEPVAEWRLFNHDRMEITLSHPRLHTYRRTFSHRLLDVIYASPSGLVRSHSIFFFFSFHNSPLPNTSWRHIEATEECSPRVGMFLPQRQTWAAAITAFFVCSPPSQNTPWVFFRASGRRLRLSVPESWAGCGKLTARDALSKPQPECLLASFARLLPPPPPPSNPLQLFWQQIRRDSS